MPGFFLQTPSLRNRAVGARQASLPAETNPVYTPGAAALPTEILQTLVLGLLIGFTGALAPGPTLVATINASLKGDWTAGLKVSLGHIVIETAIFFLIILGLASVAQPYTTAIAVIGGIALIIFGILTIRGSRSASLSTAPAQAVENPYMAGLVTSAANPYFWIWWLSVGSALLISSLAGGLLLAVVFMIGHWGADVELVRVRLHRGLEREDDPFGHHVPPDHGGLRRLPRHLRPVLPCQPVPARTLEPREPVRLMCKGSNTIPASQVDPMADTVPPRDIRTLITQFRTSEHWAVSLARDLLWVIGVVGSIAILLWLICGTWPAVVTIESGSMIPNMNIGDLVVVVEKDRFGELQTWDEGKVSGYKKYGDYGDVIIYRPNGYTDMWAQIGLLPFSGQHPIIHRAITWTEAGEPVPLYINVYKGSVTPAGYLPVAVAGTTANGYQILTTGNTTKAANYTPNEPGHRHHQLGARELCHPRK